MKVLVTGSAGFIAGYLVQELLDRGYSVVGIDNFSKYGHVEKSYQKHPKYQFAEGDCKDTKLLTELIKGCDHFVACAARIGGITYFHEYAYDLLADNERIIAASFDAAIAGLKAGTLKKITVLSSSMVFEIDRVSHTRRTRTKLPATCQYVRLPETRLRILLPGGMGTIQAAVHHLPAVQLCRHRRTAGIGR